MCGWLRAAILLGFPHARHAVSRAYGSRGMERVHLLRACFKRWQGVVVCAALRQQSGLHEVLRRSIGAYLHVICVTETLRLSPFNLTCSIYTDTLVVQPLDIFASAKERRHRSANPPILRTRRLRNHRNVLIKLPQYGCCKAT